MLEVVEKLKNINHLTTDEKSQLYEGVYQKQSRFQKNFQKDLINVESNDFMTQFRESIENMLLDKQLINEPVPLEQLHEVISPEMRAYNFNDGVNKISTYFYETAKEFSELYSSFVRNELTKYFRFPFYFQATPTIRLHCPYAENSNHYPRYHTDIGYGHPPDEINIWFPLTQKIDGHGFRCMNIADSKKILEPFNYHFDPMIEKAIHDKDFTSQCNQYAKPVTTEFGEMMLFDSRCIHTVEPMQTHTRISIDIRIIAVEDYNAMKIEYQGSGRRRILFKPGGCYNPQPIV